MLDKQLESLLVLVETAADKLQAAGGIQTGDFLARVLGRDKAGPGVATGGLDVLLVAPAVERLVQHIRVDRLGDVVVHADIQALCPVVGDGVGGECDDGQVLPARIGAQPSGGLPALGLDAGPPLPPRGADAAPAPRSRYAALKSDPGLLKFSGSAPMISTRRH